MIVLPAKRKLVLDTSRFADIQAAIPHAKVFEHNGKTLTAMEHGIDEVLVLRNLGFKQTPAPILSYYDFPARFEAMEHQKATAAFLTSNRRALCLNAPGTGKSVSALWAADYLLTAGSVKAVLIIAPLSTLKPVWANELRQHFPYRNSVVITGDRAKKTRLINTPNLQFAIINHDGFTTMASELEGKFDLIIYDEATALKTPSTQRFRKFFKWVNDANPWLWLLTGTPISQNPVDAWTLARLVNSPTVPKSYTAFKDLTMQKVTEFKWVAKPNALETCKLVLQPSIRYSLDECKDLPDTVYLDHECDLTATQRALFKDMQEECLASFSGGTISAANAAVMFTKLLQICCGAVYGDEGDTIELDAQYREELLQEVLEEIGDKCIVYVPFRGVQSYLKAALTKAGYDVALVNGSVGKTERDGIFDAFQNTPKYNVLLAHPKVASHGLTLTRAKDVVWFAPIYSLESYEQANARIRRLTTEGKTRVHHLYSTPFEKELYTRLKTRQRVLTNFLELVKGINE
jgi:SNF2 family DNA or RNA helicase